MSWFLGKGFLRETAVNTAITGGLYSGMALMSSGEATDKGAHFTKYGVAAGIDTAWDIGYTAATAGLTGGWGLAAFALNAVAGFAGLDPAGIALGAMNKMDQSYDRLIKNSNPYMTEMSSQVLQRHVQSLHGAGSNIAEMMHS